MILLEFRKTLGLVLLSVAVSMAGELQCADGTPIASVSFEGLEHTNPRVVERELLNKAGEPFSAEKFEAEKLRLQDLDLFTEISVSCTSGLDSSGTSYPQNDTLSSLVTRLN